MSHHVNSGNNPLGLEYLGYPKQWKRFKHLWTRGYYCGSPGHVSQDAVKLYILEQAGKEVFEYTIYGDHTGQTKIGDFTRWKLWHRSEKKLDPIHPQQ